MDAARSKVTGELVHAVNARSGPDYYQCPCCGADVFRKGGYADSAKRAFFAHRSGEGDSECENYHPGTALVDLESQQGHSLALYVFVPQPAATTPSWHLQILIPDCDDDSPALGRVFVDNAVHGVVSVPVTTIAAGGSRVSVHAQTEPYHVRQSGIVDSLLLRKLAGHTPGLWTTKLNAFRFSDRGGRRLERRTALLWGHGYYIVWHKTMPILCPSGLWRRQLQVNGDWCCAEVELPDEESAAIARWARQYLDRDVELAPLDLTIVTPIPMEELQTGVLVIPEAQDIIIGITARPGVLPPQQLCVRQSHGRVDYVTLTGACPIMVSLGCSAGGMIEISLPDRNTDTLRLYAKQRAGPVDVAGVELVFRQPSSTIETAWPAYCREVDLLLAGVRIGTTNLSALRLPLRVEPILSTVDADARVSHQDTLANPFDRGLSLSTAQNSDDRARVWREYTEHIRQTITTVCADTGSACDLDFGNFGSVHVGTAHGFQIEQETVSLSPAMRRQLQWVLSLGMSAGQGGPRAPGDSLRLLRRMQPNLYNRLTAADRPLVRRLLEHPRWPVAAEAHLRVLARTMLVVIGAGASLSGRRHDDPRDTPSVAIAQRVPFIEH